MRVRIKTLATGVTLGLANLCNTDMFRALQKADLPKETVFTVTVGPSSKETEAAYHLLEPADVVDSIGLLVGTVTIEDIEKAGAEVKPSL